MNEHAVTDLEPNVTEMREYVVETLDSLDAIESELHAKIAQIRRRMRLRLYALERAADPDVSERVRAALAGEVNTLPVDLFVEKIQASL